MLGWGVVAIDETTETERISAYPGRRQGPGIAYSGAVHRTVPCRAVKHFSELILSVDYCGGAH